MSEKIQIKRDYSCGGLVWHPEKLKLAIIKVKNLLDETVWTFPKGHPNLHETDEQTALREVEEETGWTCEIVNPLMDVHYSYVHKKVKYNKTVRWFYMHPVKEIRPPDKNEIIEMKWCSVEEAKKILKYDSDQKLLKRLSLIV